MYFEQKQRIAVYTVSSVIGLLLMLIPFLYGLYYPQMPYLVPLSQKVNNTMACGLIIAFSLPAIIEFNNCRWGRQVDRNLPRLLRDVTEAVRCDG